MPTVLDSIDRPSIKVPHEQNGRYKRDAGASAGPRKRGKGPPGASPRGHGRRSPRRAHKASLELLPELPKPQLPSSPSLLDVDDPLHGPTQQHPVGLLGTLEAWDLAASAVIQHWRPGPVVDLVMAFPALICGYLSMPVILLGLGLVGELDFLCVAAAGTGAVLLTTDVLKRATKRIRPSPFVLAKRIVNLRSLERTNALPSADSAQAALWASLLSCRVGSPWPYLAVPVIQFGRVYFGCHWIGDTMLGSLIGLLWARVLVLLMPMLPCGCYCLTGRGGPSSTEPLGLWPNTTQDWAWQGTPYARVHVCTAPAPR